MERWRPLILPFLLSSAVTCANANLMPPCGDGLLAENEECDDGNLVDDDGCNSACRLECGNGVLDGDEECDDGNQQPDDGCDDRCLVECGNGVLDGNEECEPSLTAGCTELCQWDPSADGDGDGDSDSDMLLSEFDGTITLEGELDDQSETWHRPIGGCSALSSTGEVFAFHTYVISNDQDIASIVTIDVLAAESSAGTLADPLFFLYEGPEIPDDPLDCVAGDDDSGEGLEPRLESIRLWAGQQYTFVVTSFYEVSHEKGYGTFELVIARE